MAKENALQDKCIAYLKSQNIYYINQYGNGRTGKGTADLVCCIDGKFVGFELKVEGNKPSPAQIIKGKRIEKSGGLFFVVYNLTDFINIINILRG